jgi:hypothetical protein
LKIPIQFFPTRSLPPSSFRLPWGSKIDINEKMSIIEYWNTGMMGDPA